MNTHDKIMESLKEEAMQDEAIASAELASKSVSKNEEVVAMFIKTPVMERLLRQDISLIIQGRANEWIGNSINDELAEILTKRDQELLKVLAELKAEVVDKLISSNLNRWYDKSEVDIINKGFNMGIEHSMIIITTLIEEQIKSLTNRS